MKKFLIGRIPKNDQVFKEDQRRIFKNRVSTSPKMIMDIYLVASLRAFRNHFDVVLKNVTLKSFLKKCKMKMVTQV